jgi:hypothetical protein
LVRSGDIDVKITDAAQEVVGVDVPFLLVSDIDIRGDDTQAKEACSPYNGWQVNSLFKRSACIPYIPSKSKEKSKEKKSNLTSPMSWVL